MLIYVLFKCSFDTLIILLLIILVDELVTLKSILKDIRDNSISLLGEKDALRALFHDTGFNFRQYDNR
jgi:hypothetical protein